MGETKIQWTDRTWNPVRGCTKISPGCKHCYAETFAERFRGVKGHAYEQGFDLRLVPEKLDEPLRWRQPSMVFVNSMSDLFHEEVPIGFISQVFGTMARCPRHTFQILTKRADRMRAFFDSASGRIHGMPFEEGVPLPNVWLGVSVEDRKHGLPRLDELREPPAAVRFVSFEPLLEDLGDVDLRGIDWAIIGGESGAGARPLVLAWVRSLLAQCRAAGVAPFVKQLGARPMMEGEYDHSFDGEETPQLVRLRDRKHGGDPAEWPEDLRVREFPTIPNVPGEASSWPPPSGSASPAPRVKEPSP